MYCMVATRTLKQWTLVLFCATLVLFTTAEPEANKDFLQRQYDIRQAREITRAQCNFNCSTVKQRPVCASDGKTYPSRCQVNQLSHCEGRHITVRSKGVCPDPNESKCFQERDTARKQQSRKPTVDIFVPDCAPDGSFNQVQCHTKTGYCWCANTGDGKPVPGSSVKAGRGKKINCRGRPNKRRSGRGKGRRGCSQTDRSTFNANLIKLFSEEYSRIPKPSHNPTIHNQYPPGVLRRDRLPIKAESDSLLDTPEKRVIEWKFSELDSDKDNQLKSKEIRSLKRMVKRLVKPRSCARNFVKYCDLDQDKRIARSEWSVCLGVDINKDQATASPTGRLQRTGDRMINGPTLWNKQILQSREEPLTPERPAQMEETPAAKNCEEERSAALERHKADPDGGIFIPECGEGSTYSKAQCHTSTGYCWCVNIHDGVPIRGTSTYNVTPDCDNIVEEREIKACPHPLKKQFLTEYLDKMTTEMVEYANNATADSSKLPPENPESSLEERVVTWKLHMLDRNRNMRIDRGELRSLKKEIRKIRKKSIRVCGKHFIPYCDVNEDRKIELKEWIDCMGVNEQARNLPVNPKRRGPNPFIGQLQD